MGGAYEDELVSDYRDWMVGPDEEDEPDEELAFEQSDGTPGWRGETAGRQPSPAVAEVPA